MSKIFNRNLANIKKIKAIYLNGNNKCTKLSFCLFLEQFNTDESAFCNTAATAVDTDNWTAAIKIERKTNWKALKKQDFLYVCVLCYVQAQQYNLREATGTQFFGQTQGGNRLQGGPHRRYKGKLLPLPLSLSQNKVPRSCSALLQIKTAPESRGTRPGPGRLRFQWGAARAWGRKATDCGPNEWGSYGWRGGPRAAAHSERYAHTHTQTYTCCVLVCVYILWVCICMCVCVSVCA